MLANWLIVVSPCLSLGGSVGARTTSAREQSTIRPLKHLSQWPQNTERQVMTRSPGFRYVTWSPTASTVPAASWPKMMGIGVEYRPCTKCKSLWANPGGAGADQHLAWPRVINLDFFNLERTIDLAQHCRFS